MKKQKILFTIAAIIVTISNILMMIVFNNGEEIFSNIFLVLVCDSIWFGIMLYGNVSNKRKLRPECWGIWALVSASVIRLINRIDPTGVPDVVNWTFCVIIIGTGNVLLVMGIMRFIKKRK